MLFRSGLLDPVDDALDTAMPGEEEEVEAETSEENDANLAATGTEDENISAESVA